MIAFVFYFFTYLLVNDRMVVGCCAARPHFNVMPCVFVHYFCIIALDLFCFVATTLTAFFVSLMHFFHAAHILFHIESMDCCFGVATLRTRVLYLHTDTLRLNGKGAT